MSPNQKAQSFINKMYNAKSGNNRPMYKRVYIQGGGKEFKLRLLSTELIDVIGAPFETVWLHSNYKHPNFPNQQYSSTFRCLGGPKKCPLCQDVKNIYEFEKANKVANKEKTGFKKAAKPYSLYWAINMVNNELSLVHVPQRGQYEDDIAAQEVLFKKIEDFVKQTGEVPFDYERGSVITITSKTVDKRDRFSVEIDPTPHAVDAKVLKLFETMPTLKSIYVPYSAEDLDHIAKGIRIEKGTPGQRQDNAKKSQMQDKINNVSNEDFSMEDLDQEYATGDNSGTDDGLSDEERKLLGDSESDTAFLEDDSFNLDPDDGGNDLQKKLSKIDFGKLDD